MPNHGAIHIESLNWRSRRYAPRPRGEKRPADLMGAAVKVMRIATGEEEDDRKATSSAVAELGKLGGAARATAMTTERRAEIAKGAAAGAYPLIPPTFA